MGPSKEDFRQTQNRPSSSRRMREWIWSSDFDALCHNFFFINFQLKILTFLPSSSDPELVMVCVCVWGGGLHLSINVWLRRLLMIQFQYAIASAVMV